MLQGTVRWFDPERGFGFLAPGDGSADLFVHASEIVGDGGARLLREGQTVDYLLGEGDRGPQAKQVRVTGGPAAGATLGQLGTMAWYEPAKGYGFVRPDGGGAELFVHSSAILTGGILAEGQRVAFLVGEGERGPHAENVIPLGAGESEAVPTPAPAGDGADGTVSWFDEDKGFGFITPDAGGDDVFAHVRAFSEGLTYLVEGDRVTYDVVVSDKGPQARDLQLVHDATTAASPAPTASAGPARSGSAGSARSGRPPAEGPPARAGEGVVARYDPGKGFGFITPDAGGADLFVHISVLAGTEPLQAGERVRFAVRQSDRGPQADKVERL